MTSSEPTTAILSAHKIEHETDQCWCPCYRLAEAAAGPPASAERLVDARKLGGNKGNAQYLSAQPPPASVEAEGLDVPTLARAITANWKILRKVPWDAGGTPLEIARKIATSYLLEQREGTRE